MSSKLTSLFNLVPKNIWKPLKKFVTKDDIEVIDVPLKLSTKYTVGLLIVLMCLSFANQFVRDVDLDCYDAEEPHVKGKYNKQLNDYCWNYETFLVVRGLQPDIRKKAIYPGITQYDRGVDEIIIQRYYKYVWLIFAILAVMSFLPYFFWKTTGLNKLKPLVVITRSEDYAEDKQRLDYFLETVGFNESFSWSYVGCKVLATLLPLWQWYFVCGFVGAKFKYYGIEVLSQFMDIDHPWPNPMDILFPKIAKCNWNFYNTADQLDSILVRAALCNMPMNNITQWSFFILWVWMALVLFINILSLLILLLHCFPSCRNHRYRKLIGVVCRKDVNKLRNLKVSDNIKFDEREVIYVNLSFGDWLVLSFLEQNTAELTFTEFMRLMATTKNTIIQLKPMPVPILDTLNEVIVDENRTEPDKQKESVTTTESKHSFTQLQKVYSDQSPVKLNPRVKVDRKLLRNLQEKDKNPNVSENRYDRNIPSHSITFEENSDNENPHGIYTEDDLNGESSSAAMYTEENWD